MKFLCIGYFDATKMGARPKEEIDALMEQCRPHLDELYASGQVICDIGVLDGGKCLRRVNGVVTAADNPAPKGDEAIGGAFLIEAHDMDDAIRVASLHPATRIPEGEKLGWHTEIRPVYLFKTPGDNLK